MLADDVVFAIPDDIIFNCQTVDVIRIDYFLITRYKLIVADIDFRQWCVINYFTIQQAFNGNYIASASEITRDKCIILI